MSDREHGNGGSSDGFGQMDHADITPQIEHLLEPEEEVHAAAQAREALLALTSRRLIVTEGDRVALNVSIDNIRRIQFDIERHRPAALVIVPEHPADAPQVLSIEPPEYERTARTLAIIGLRLADGSPRSA